MVEGEHCAGSSIHREFCEHEESVAALGRAHPTDLGSTARDSHHLADPVLAGLSLVDGAGCRVTVRDGVACMGFGNAFNPRKAARRRRLHSH